MRRRDLLRLAAGGLGLGLGGRGAGADFGPLGSVELPGAKEAVVSDDGRTVYAAVTDGFAVVDASDPAAPEVIAERRGLLAGRERGPVESIWDVKVDGDRLLVVGPAHTAGSRLRAALVYDVADPAEPELAAVHETDFGIHNAFLDDGYAYLAGNDREDEPLVILDVEAGEVGRWSPVDHDDRWAGVNPWLRQLHDVWVHGGLAYCAYWDAGTWIVDVSDPAEPAFVARVGGRPRDELAAITSGIGREISELPGNDHYCATDERGRLLAVGKEAWSDDPERAPGGIDLWDVSDPAEPILRGNVPPPSTPDPSRDGVWTTTHNFELRGGRLYSSWYQGGVKIHDVSDPASPRELAWWRDPSRTRFWTARRSAEGFVASSMGVGGAPAAIYAFPDRAGTQSNPPSLTVTQIPTTASTPSSSGSSNVTGTGKTGGTAPTSSPDGSPDHRPTASSTAAGTPGHVHGPGHTHSRAATPGTTPTVVPGFGVAATLFALALAAHRRRRSG